MPPDKSSCEIMLLHYALEFGCEAFTFSLHDAHQIPNFLPDFQALVGENLIEEAEVDDLGIRYFRVSEEGHHKVSKFLEDTWDSLLPLLEKSYRKNNQ